MATDVDWRRSLCFEVQYEAGNVPPTNLAVINLFGLTAGSVECVILHDNQQSRRRIS